ncbi:WG repeat-containing protein [Roseivirga sp. BDSF3-8]|uniref:WG repeat-containing protein n=1 Tax=Roseivirga sp. BDSF3-8 TaxID=3241598 RepID=UPI003532619B
MRKHLLVLTFICLAGLVLAGPGKRALRLIQKHKFEKAEKVLNKGLEKDTLAPAVHYAYATLYFDSAYTHVNIDSAYSHVLKAEAQLTYLDDRDIAKLVKIPAGPQHIAYLKDQVDSAAFYRAAARHTEQSYQDYYLTHADAAQRPEAERRRNEIAFDEASRLNTYESFSHFMEKYPEAPQVKEAGKLYEIRLYEDATSDNTLTQYRQFIREYPSSPYLEDARQNVLMLQTLNGEPDSFQTFLNEYPQSKWSPLAATYYTFLTGKTPQNIASPLNDSLVYLLRLDSLPIFPVRQSGAFSFYFSDGSNVKGVQLDSIPADYLCGAIKGFAFNGYEGNAAVLYSRLGEKITVGVSETEPLAGGSMIIRKGEYYGVVHPRSGAVLPAIYDDIRQAGTLLITNNRGRKGLYSLMGRKILGEEYDLIQADDHYIFATVDGKTTLYFKSDLLALAENRLPRRPVITASKTGTNHQLWVRIPGGNEAVYDSIGNEVLAPSGQALKQAGDAWLATDSQSYRLVRADGSLWLRGTAEEVLSNGKWLAVKSDSSWSTLYLPPSELGENALTGSYDSVALVGDEAVLAYQGEKAALFITQNDSIEVEEGQQARLLIPQTVTRGITNKGSFFIQLINSRDYSQIYNNTGKRIAEGLLSHVEALTDSVISIRRGRRYGLISFTGEELLPVRYDGFSLTYPGIATLRGNRFGIYLPGVRQTIDAKYERLLKPYDGYLWLGRKKGKTGLVDPLRGELSSFEFDEIRHWNDSLFLARDGNTWNLYTPEGGQPRYREMSLIRPFGETESDKRYLVMVDKEYGVLSTDRGEILQPGFDEIVNVGTEAHPVYFAEKEVREAGVSVVVWYDEAGKILIRETYPLEELELIYCD